MQSGEPLARGRKNLVETVSDQLRRSILSGDLRPGDKLPSEAGLTQQYDVSRTVVREAIASLRADGLVEARHGVGVFVRTPPAQPALPFQSIEPSKISSIIEMLELRMGVETEAAGLAATRRSPAQEEAIWERYDDLSRLIASGQPTTAADFAFHLAIADAANNPRFREFLEMMGRPMIPRAQLEDSNPEPTPADYLKQLQAEHKQIAEAISVGDEEGARQAIRTHLKHGQERYRRLIRGS
ncbi:FadR family transcriptional regulator [Microvirga sp. KLBC 81]|uniref:FadR/GntR family transcriptional regulator n=1 Tax=Microvirga sp. KLBC 81 TaxID=1862707 RepID=UPI000D5117A5|nr:FadR/GntR family transcriptional regulator [Microvirga sp. KLBC 81]PVE25756.1 FadR family transcriptional regulator [Microvirga sp. KLBC 81]